MDTTGARKMSDVLKELERLRSNVEDLRSQLHRARRDAERAVRAKGDFLANMSHELRTPMTSILGFTELLVDGGHSIDRVMRLDHLKTIRRNGVHLTRILDDILDLSKIEAGTIDVSLERVSVFQILRDITSVLQGAAADKGIGLEVTYDSPIPLTIQTDQTRLRQILINLVGNAIKFTAKGGVHVGVRLSETGELVFRVVDTGPGMSPEAATRVFDAFWQGDTSATRNHGGTGLGLAISNRLAELLGGILAVETLEGQGSTFTLRIDPSPIHDVPLVDAPLIDADDEDEDTESNTEFLDRIRVEVPDARVLLVEDGDDNRRLVRFTLERAGFGVDTAVNGAVGVELALAARARDEEYDVILMDMQMPVLDGYEATRKLRASGYEGVIIALTAHAMKGERDRCLEAGCDEYATKPIDRRSLVARIAEVATRHDKR